MGMVERVSLGDSICAGQELEPGRMRSSDPRARIDATRHRGTTKWPIVRVNRENLTRFVLIYQQNGPQIDLSRLAR